MATTGTEPPRVTPEKPAPPPSPFDVRNWGWGLGLRIVLLAMLNGLAVWSLAILIGDKNWLGLAALVVSVAALDWIFISPRGLPLRWLVPGVIFMVALLIYPLFYTFYVALTNWSTGHTLSKGQAIERTLEAVYLPDDPQRFDVYYYENPAGELKLLLDDGEGNLYFGSPRLETEEPIEDGLDDLTAATVTDDDGDGIPEQINEFARLSLPRILQLEDIDDLAFDTPIGQALPEARSASLKDFRYDYDEARDVLVDNELGVECRADPEIGNFVCPDGSFAGFGWRVLVGVTNFTDVATDERIRQPIVRVFIWNMVYASLSVALQFGLGMIFALAFQKPDLRGKTLYRSLLIVPWAMPAFISIIVWRSLLQGTDFGPVNSALGPLLSLFGTDAISWLNDPFWAKVSILLVNLWLGFPYFFLVVSGALAAIPTDVQEAARTDGASAWNIWRKITLPLLMISVAPLLIASFAFNFNNFVNIFLLTRGGPPLVGYDVPVGETDILISFTYNVALARSQDYGLASAITFFIFLIVVVLSAASFRLTRRLETVYGR